jgi:hypothetical protein
LTNGYAFPRHFRPQILISGQIDHPPANAISFIVFSIIYAYAFTVKINANILNANAYKTALQQGKIHVRCEVCTK